MIRCPNCGSTSQTKTDYIPNSTRTSITERITCGCGCVTLAIYKLSKEETRTADGTKIGYRKGDG